MRRLFNLIFLAAFAFCLCGCVDISRRTLADGSAAESTGAQTEFHEIYDTYTFTEQDEQFLADCVFVGDKVCGGLSYYGLVSEQDALSSDSAAEKLLEAPFLVKGDSVEPLTAIVNAGKGNVVLWLSGTQAEAADVNEVLERIEAVCPYAECYVISAPPLSEESDEASRFNSSLAEMLSEGGRENRHFVDATDILSSSSGTLKSNYKGDGAYMSKAAYYGVLWQLCMTAAQL